MLVISGTLVAVILAGEGSAPEPPTLAEFTATAEAQATGTAVAEATAAAPTAAPEPTPEPSVPPRLQARFDALPERLQEETLAALRSGSIDIESVEQIIENYETRNVNVRFGPILGLDEDSLRMEVITTGEEIEVLFDEDTEVSRNDEVIDIVDLQLEELIMVVLHDGTSLAASIEGLGVAAP